MPEKFEVATAGELRRKYGLVENPHRTLNPENVPSDLRHLMGYAEVWGITDDLTREDLVSRTPKEALDDLARRIADVDTSLDKWLVGDESYSDEPSKEYLAFSAMRMASLGA